MASPEACKRDVLKILVFVAFGVFDLKQYMPQDNTFIHQPTNCKLLMEGARYCLSSILVLYSVMIWGAFSYTNITIDQLALESLKAHITIDTYNVLTANWTSDTSICYWIGITCSSRHNRVTALNIPQLGFTGTLPTQIGKLSFLAYLNISYNNFQGLLPKELATLTRLRVFDITFNAFSGEIPSWFESFPKLVFLSLRNNLFTGSIPPSLSIISQLNGLDLSFNSLEGMIPVKFGDLQNLQVLNLGYCNLSGSIPSSIFNLSKLDTMDFTGNSLTGTLPTDLCSHQPSIRRIVLSSNQLSGQLPYNLSKCSNLQYLLLLNNRFTGIIPKAIGDLKMLVVLALRSNSLEGPIPQELCYLQKLEYLYMEHNNLSGPIPNTIGNMSSLQVLSMNGNMLSGQLPREIGNLSMLTMLYLHQNHLTGCIPQEFGKLYRLEVFDVQINELRGSLPEVIFNISVLQMIAVSENNLSGILPESMGNGLPNLEGLFLSFNRFSGTIPSSLSNASKLVNVSMSSNEFIGLIPESLGNLRYLQAMYLGANYLTASSDLSFITSFTSCRNLVQLQIQGNYLNGTLPPSIGNFSSAFKYLYAENIGARGEIPRDIGNLSGLISLGLSGNYLTGSIPTTLQGLPELQSLDFSRNYLSGSIPVEICTLYNLVEIFITENEITGSLPSCLGNVSSLRNVYLYSNKITSSIPKNIWNLKDLIVLSLFSNLLTGPINPDVGTLTHLVIMDLSNNQLSGDIPSTVQLMQSLATLSLSRNRIQGSIPDALGQLLSLESLDLSNNNLSGGIPESLVVLRYLIYFNVSFNILSGQIPNDGPFRNFTYSSFMSNEALCGAPRFYFPPCYSKPLESSRKKRLFIALILTSTGVIITLLLLFIWLMFRYRKGPPVRTAVTPIETVYYQRFTYVQLKEATDDFNDSNLLGKGSVGSVFKATFEKKTIFAVKVFNLKVEDSLKCFNNECEVLRYLRHRNLTKIISSCYTLNFKALVLEYISNGSLDKWLYSHNYFLDAMQRLKIMIDVASALQYLHHDCHVPVVHCDLKPSNILVDDDFIGHVTDFGIAVVLGNGKTIARTSTLATFGYMAPEYGLEGILSTQSDVYSFGILLMETLTRRRPHDEIFFGDFGLRRWIKRSLPDNLHRVIDDNLLKIQISMQCLGYIMELALKCSAKSATKRMNMKDALTGLEKIKIQLLTEE